MEKIMMIRYKCKECNYDFILDFSNSIKDFFELKNFVCRKCGSELSIKFITQDEIIKEV